MTKAKHVFLTTLLLSIASASLSFGENGPYIGASAGQTTVELALTDVEDRGFRIDDDDFAYKVFFGYKLPGPLAVEGGFRDLGKVTDGNELTVVTSESDGLDAFLVGSLPLGPVSIFAKGGLIAWDTEIETSSADRLGAPDVRVTDDGTDFAWGVGVSVNLARWGFRGEYEKLEMDVPDDLSMLSVGVTISW